MAIKIKKGRGIGKPRPAPVTADAPKAKAKSKPTKADLLRAALMSDPRYLAAKKKPVEQRATTCEFCGNAYIVPCDAEEKDFCINFLAKTGVVQSTAQWGQEGYAEKSNQLRLSRHAERMKAKS